MATRLSRWVNEQADNPRRHLSRFTGGGLLFALGTGLMLFAEARMLPSLQQELIALFGLIMAGLGLLLALLGYLGISVLRILTYLLPHDKK